MITCLYYHQFVRNNEISDSTANTALRAERISEETGDTLEQVRGSMDRAYVFGMVSTGIGISGIVIGAFLH